MPPRADVPESSRTWLRIAAGSIRCLQEAYAQAETENDPRKQLHASLALLPVDSGQVDYLYERLLQGEPQEVVVIREALLRPQGRPDGTIVDVAGEPEERSGPTISRGLCVGGFSLPTTLAGKKSVDDVAATLVIQKPFVIAQWTEALKGVGSWLIPPLAAFLVDEKRSVSERGLIASVYGTYAADVPDAYARLEKQLDETS